MENKTLNFTPAIILALVAIIVLLFSLLVMEKSQSPQLSSTRNNSELSADNNLANTQQRYQWSLVSAYPKNFPGLGVASNKLAAYVDAASNGRLQIKVYGSNELVPALGVFDAVSSGSVEMGHSAAYYWKGKIPAAPLFTAVPFGMNATEMNGWLHYGGGLELWREVYAPFNLIPFAGGNTGVQMGGWFNREINSLEDLQGLKMRIPGLGGEVMNRAGASAINIAGGELYTALQTGVIDATEWVGPYNDLAFGFQQIAKYYYYPGWQEPGPNLEFIVNQQAYQSLPEDLQKILELAMRTVNQDTVDEFTARNNGALVELKEKYKVDVRPYPDDVLQKLKAISDDIYAEQSAADPIFAKVYKSFKDFYDKVRSYHDISEAGYYKARDIADGK